MEQLQPFTSRTQLDEASPEPYPDAGNLKNENYRHPLAITVGKYSGDERDLQQSFTGLRLQLNRPVDRSSYEAVEQISNKGKPPFVLNSSVNQLNVYFLSSNYFVMGSGATLEKVSSVLTDSSKDLALVEEVHILNNDLSDEDIGVLLNEFDNLHTLLIERVPGFLGEAVNWKGLSGVLKAVSFKSTGFTRKGLGCMFDACRHLSSVHFEDCTRLIAEHRFERNGLLLKASSNKETP